MKQLFLTTDDNDGEEKTAKQSIAAVWAKTIIQQGETTDGDKKSVHETPDRLKDSFQHGNVQEIRPSAALQNALLLTDFVRKHELKNVLQWKKRIAMEEAEGEKTQPLNETEESAKLNVQMLLDRGCDQLVKLSKKTLAPVRVPDLYVFIREEVARFEEAAVQLRDAYCKKNPDDKSETICSNKQPECTFFSGEEEAQTFYLRTFQAGKKRNFSFQHVALFETPNTGVVKGPDRKSVV